MAKRRTRTTQTPAAKSPQVEQLLAERAATRRAFVAIFDVLRHVEREIDRADQALRELARQSSHFARQSHDSIVGDNHARAANE